MDLTSLYSRLETNLPAVSCDKRHLDGRSGSSLFLVRGRDSPSLIKAPACNGAGTVHVSAGLAVEIKLR